MKELAELIIKISGKNLKPKIAGFGKETRLKEREIEYRVPDISKIKSLGWQPKTMIKEGVKKILDSKNS